MVPQHLRQHGALVLNAFACVLILRHAEAASYLGRAECPCIEWADIANHRDGSGNLEYKPFGSLKSHEYPSNYGNYECKPHDLGLPPHCDRGSSSQEWCQNSWCYVDEDDCTLTKMRSRFFKGVGDLYFSYEACADPASGNFSNSFMSWEADGQQAQSGDLYSLIAGYLAGTRAQVEKAFSDIEDWGAVSQCGYTSMCPCQRCVDNSAWGQQVDLSDVGFIPKRSNDVAACLADAISDSFRKVAAKESKSKGGGVGYQYFADQDVGSYAQWPNMDWCPASDFDFRFRPWYASTSTGAKDVIILIDVSGSMSKNGRGDLARKAAKAILNTLSWKDYVAVILFDSSIYAVFKDLMVPVTEAQRNVIHDWLDTQSYHNGGTDFRKAFFEESGAFDVLDKSIQDRQTSMCQKAIMFLTDGEADFSDSDFQEVRKKSTELGAILFTYAIGSGADASTAKRLACDNRGIFHNVNDGADLAGVMSAYYKYFAAGQEVCEPSFVSYTDAITGTNLYAGCLPMYNRKEAEPHLLGVSCMDMNSVHPIGEIRAMDGWAELMCKISDRSKMCRPLMLTDCHIEKLRAQYSASSVCSSVPSGNCPCFDHACQDDSSWKDAQGYFCDAWAGDDCNKAADWGYNSGQVADIKSKCKRSCGLCPLLDPCPTAGVSACPASTLALPATCRACETDKVSGVDIEGCRMGCHTAERICDAPQASVSMRPSATRPLLAACAVYGVVHFLCALIRV